MTKHRVPSRPPRTGAKRKVLIVDDEPGVVRLLSEILREDGYACLSCSSAQEALDVIKPNGIDAILCDLHMPGMSGMELLQIVRTDHPHVAFVMITGEGDIRIGVQAMRDGAHDYLLKPLNFGAVQMSIKQVLERKDMEEKLENYRLLLEEMVDQRTELLRKALSRIEQNYEETLHALATALEMRDTGTAGHTRRVMAYAVQIAKTMGCTKEQLHSLTLAALLHDMGKIGIPDSVLSKKTELTPEERDLMQTHVTRGYNLLHCIAFLGGAAEIILAHHERFDGDGYPQQLKAQHIPMGARIYAVADTLAALTSDRPFRWAMSFAAAREKILHEAGRQFDPVVVSAFLSIDAQTWEELRGGNQGAKTWENEDTGAVLPALLGETLHLLGAQ
jgi:response regulator RpfG family c-di-GMP phosphodiesterase